MRIIDIINKYIWILSDYLKDFEGNKIFGTEFQRANGWCELVLGLICIAHPGVAVLMEMAIGADVRQRYMPNLV